MKQFIFLLAVASLFLSCGQEKPEFVFSETMNPSNEHLRGISMVDSLVAWASGTHGSVLKTVDGGRNWKHIQIPGAEELDFRDIHGFSDNEALVISAGSPGRIYRTDDGGTVWNLIFNNTSKEIFMDGMDFSDPEHGMIYGDPLGNALLLMRSSNGMAWERVILAAMIPEDGEAGYAASGTGIVVHGQKAWFATSGSNKSRVFRTTDFGDSWEFTYLPMRSASGAGIFSICFSHDDLLGIAVGGDYKDSTRSDSNAAITFDGGQSWKLIDEGELRGYRSVVREAAWDEKSVFVASGRTGSEFSLDGLSWHPLLDEGYYALDFAGNIGWMVGRSGKMKKIRVL